MRQLLWKIDELGLAVWRMAYGLAVGAAALCVLGAGVYVVVRFARGLFPH